jgi:subfamily B ATP-binding cassette protein MsbA
VRKFSQFNNNFQQAIGASSAIFDFLDCGDDIHEKPNAVVLPPFHQGICFENVHFSYRNGDDGREVLHDINLRIAPGEVIAIVGSSGGGKTTLVHLLPRFFDVTAGRLLIDGHDVRDLKISSLRSQIAMVTQDTILFNDSILNNIAYGHPETSRERVEEAARAALAHDFILALPEGYDTVIGERGLMLSGGERQRISIARAILKDAPVLVLDEATSALDTESESLVQSALQNLMTGRTVFVVAHRLSTVRRADRIIVLENGMIVDEGNHDRLMARTGTYRRLYDLQFEDVEANSRGE